MQQDFREESIFFFACLLAFPLCLYTELFELLEHISLAVYLNWYLGCLIVPLWKGFSSCLLNLSSIVTGTKRRGKDPFTKEVNDAVV